MESSKFLLPQMCCKCLEAAEQTYEIGGVYQKSDSFITPTTVTTTTYTLEAPICARCSWRITRIKFLGVVLLVVIPTVVWFLVRFLVPRGGLACGLNAGGVFFGICACVGLWDLSKPGKVTKKGLPLFSNPQYQSKFEEANNIDPESYGLLDQLYKATSMVPVKLGAGTNILKFPSGFEAQYLKHLQLISKLKAAGVYPSLKVYGLKATKPDVSCARLIVITGSAEATRKLSKVFYTREAEDFVATECGGNWDAINPASSLSNIPDAGSAVDRGSFDNLVKEIHGIRYDVQEILD